MLETPAVQARSTASIRLRPTRANTCLRELHPPGVAPRAPRSPTLRSHASRRRRPDRGRDRHRRTRAPSRHPLASSAPRRPPPRRPRPPSAAPSPSAGRARHFDACMRASALDKRRAGGLLAGGIAFRLFVWILPAALLVTGVFGLVRTISPKDPATVARNSGLGGVVANAVGSASQQSSQRHRRADRHRPRAHRVHRHELRARVPARLPARLEAPAHPAQGARHRRRLVLRRG